MSAMLADLIAGLAAEIRALGPADAAAGQADEAQRLVARLSAAGLLDHEALIAVMLRRADEERIASAVRTRAHSHSAFLQALIADPDERISAAAMALVLARGRRRDRLGQIRLEFDDLPRDLAGVLAHAVAAGLCQRPGSPDDSREEDRQLSESAAAVVDRHDPSRSIEAVTSGLVEALSATDKLDEPILHAALEEGDIAFVTHALAARAGISSGTAWGLLIDGADGRVALLLRMAAVSRIFAAMLLALVADFVGISDPAEEIARFESLEDSDLDRATARSRLNPLYLSALVALGGRG